VRIERLRKEPLARGEPFTFRWEGRDVEAYAGETVLGALLADGIRTLRRAPRTGEPRGMLCGIGACYDCVVTVNGVANQRACMVVAAPGLDVRSAPPGFAAEGGSDG